MISLLTLNALLIILLAMTNWDHCLSLLWRLYSATLPWFTTSTVLGLYGMVLVYLLVVVHVDVPRATEHSSQIHRKKQRLVPYYDHNGQLKGWVREEEDGTVFQTKLLPGTTLPQSLSSRLPSNPPATAVVSSPPHLYSDENLPDFTLTSWDGFPDHRFRCHFTRQQVEDTSRLAFYWISDKRPGRRGSLDAITPEKGSSPCKAVVCTVRIAPGQNVARQLEAFCTCSSTLHHRSCEVEWSVVFYRNGAIFENSGAHTHSKYTHLLPTAKNKTLQLQEFIAKQPIVLRGSQGNINGISQSNDSHIREEELEAVDSDADEGAHCDLNVDNSGDQVDEERLDPEADENKEER
ncbi:hypothetical protein B0H11DRAFT_2075843 [Mycena galericulata]|nr:hypothetical protein B0H11DRAFT_2075843 [Mycena galericulata]